MKIEIITLHNINNYGSVLQTYATQEIFKSLGYETEVIDYWRENTLPKYIAKEMLEKSTRLNKVGFIWKKSKTIKNLLIKLICLQLEHSETPTSRFLKENVRLTTRRYTSFDELKKYVPIADIYVTGSDQVWNSIYNGGIDQAYYLGFIPKNKVKIAFASSIGRSAISNQEKEIIKPLLSQYQAISVRESSAVKLLKSIGIEAKLVLDPTLLLDGEEWKKLDSKAPICKKPYLLIYQLNSNKKMDEYAEKLASKMNWEIVRLGFSHSDKYKSGRCIMHPSVQSFVNLFSNANCVITDSFHATAFSLNLGTDFINILPPRFGTRIRSILELTQTEDRLLTDYDDFSIVGKKINKDKVRGILEHERRENMEWLNKVLSNVKENKN